MNEGKARASVAGLEEVLAALANPVRRAALERLGRGEATVSELAAACRVTLPVMSRHLSTLLDAGLVQREREGRRQWCRIRPEGLLVLVEWIDRFRSSWQASRETFSDYLRQLEGGGSGERTERS